MRFYYQLLAKLLRVSPEVINFISDNRKRYFQKLAIILPLTAWSSFLYQTYPIFIKFQVDALTENWTSIANWQIGSNLEVFGVLVIVTLGLQGLDAVLKFFKDSILDKLGQQSEAYLEDKFNKFLTKFDSSFLASENNLRLIRNLQYNFDSLENKINTLLTKFIDLIVSFVAILAILPLIHPYLLSLIVVSVILNMLLEFLQNNAWRRFELVETRKSDVRYEIRWRLIWYFNRILSNGWLNQLYSNYKTRRNDWYDLKYKQSQQDRVYNLIKDSLYNIMQALTSLTAAWLVIQKLVQIGTFVVFNLYISRIQGFLSNIGTIFRTIVELRFELFRIDFLLNIKPKLDYKNIEDFNPKVIDKISIQNLHFTYPEFFQEEVEYFELMRKRLGLLEEEIKNKNEAIIKPGFNLIIYLQNLFKHLTNRSLSKWEKDQLKKEFQEIEKIFQKAHQNQPILKNLNLELKKGKIYAIVGYNGAGKTTLTKLIKRGIDPSKGEILIDSRNLKSIDPVDWKSYISSLEQESFVWDSFSIRENLTLGLAEPEKISDDELWKALKMVGIDEAIKDLDVVYSEGIELSGGQQQLLEIARIYLQKKPIVILDEGTNQLDAIKESQILNVLQEIKKKSIVIFITHRMTTCSRCDEIIVLDNGEKIVQGTHQELIKDKNPNLYQKFWNIQVLGEKPEQV